MEKIQHSYGERAALRGVSFDVHAGEIFGLLGPNGSGKTTLFRILSTLMLPSGGRALIDGFDAAKQPDEVRRRIGVVFQAQSTDIKLTAAENLWHQGHLYGLRGSTLKSRIQEMLERVGLSDRAKDRVETFSGGMQRRVELAKGLMHRPSVLLLDEPTTGLDPGARLDLWAYLNDLRKRERVSIIVTTHLMEEAERCDRLAILNQGEVVGLGTPAELRSQIGGEVVVLETADPAALAKHIQEKFKVPASLLDGKVRLEIQNGLKFVTSVAEAFPGSIQSVSISKPTLDDVFIGRTGHRFWTDAQAQQEQK
ncbi:MAG TPA: ATP-binding cassette domain-containing protein [Candidatus Angelobacter sp.]|nr:ATP-binding cassette domain-containing protein [Candidatus Angelobacter sp.]